MSINAIATGIQPAVTNTLERAGGAGQSQSSSGSFSSLVRGAIESLDHTQKTSEADIARTVAGEAPDLHKTIISLQTADLNFQLALQVRNKLIGAYEEIMRMQV